MDFPFNRSNDDVGQTELDQWSWTAQLTIIVYEKCFAFCPKMPIFLKYVVKSQKIHTFYMNTFPLKMFYLCFFCHVHFISPSQFSPSGWDKMQEPPLYHQLGTRFVEFYYGVFDNDRANLKDLYVSVVLLLLSEVPGTEISYTLSILFSWKA